MTRRKSDAGGYEQPGSAFMGAWPPRPGPTGPGVGEPLYIPTAAATAAGTWPVELDDADEAVIVGPNGRFKPAPSRPPARVWGVDTWNQMQALWRGKA